MLTTFLSKVVRAISGCLQVAPTPSDTKNFRKQKYFKPKMRRKIRVFSLGKKNNILIQKRVYANQTIDKGIRSASFQGKIPPDFAGETFQIARALSWPKRGQGKNFELISLRGWIQDHINSRQTDAFVNFWYHRTQYIYIYRLKIELKLTDEIERGPNCEYSETCIKEARKGFSLLQCLWNDARWKKKGYLMVWRNYMSPCNSIAGLYFKKTCDVISVTMATHKVQKNVH